MFRWLLAALLLASTAMAGAPSGPATQVVTPLAAEAGKERPRRVRFFPMEGLPPDSLVRAAFMQGFDEGLAAGALPTERPDADGQWQDADSLRTRFRPTNDSTDTGAWTVQVVVGAPPPYVATRTNTKTNDPERRIDPTMRASRGMTLALLALSPDDIQAGVRAMPEHLAFAFPAEAAPAGVLGDIPGGFAFPWREAGRVTATLTLELLHHHSGDLPKAARYELSPVLRAESVR